MLASDKHYKVANSTVAMLKYHLVWSTRRRRDVLRGPVADRLETLLHDTARELGIDILRLRIEPDFVHMYVVATPNLAPTQIVYRLKNGSAALRDEFEELKRIPSMWTSACLVSSAPNLRPDEIQLYIQAQSKSA
jgi:putative transposase